MTKWFNPYTYIGGAIVIVLLAASFYYQSTQIHKWHVKYDTEHELTVKQAEQILGMTTAQNLQTSVTQKNVEKVVKVPVETTRLVKEVQTVKIPQDCSTPAYSQEVKNAF